MIIENLPTTISKYSLNVILFPFAIFQIHKNLIIQACVLLFLLVVLGLSFVKSILSKLLIIFFVIVIFFILEDGASYIILSITFSKIALNPRAPVFFSIAK